MSLQKTSQMYFQAVTTDQLVSKDHVYRKINGYFDFRSICLEFRSLYSELGTAGYDVEKGVRALILQFMEDYSDREMQRALEENVAVKWFCNFELMEKTPDYSYFSKLRARLGTKNIEKLFKFVNKQLEKRGLIGQCFSFIDSSAIITKTQLWSERDEAIANGEKKLDNALVSDYAADPEARFGCKGKKKYWFGYKRHINADAKAGIITKVAVTPANISDAEGLQRVCPDSGMILADKAYSGKKAQRTIKARGCHSGAILKNNMKEKNADKDKWISKLRMPFEGIFSFFNKRSRYRGTVKVQMQGFMEALAWNIKTGVKYA